MSIVETTAGRVEGTTDGGLEVFRGIPYASPPVGELRFRAPQPHPGWAGVREATEFGAVARQHPNEAFDQMMGGCSAGAERGLPVPQRLDAGTR